MKDSWLRVATLASVADCRTALQAPRASTGHSLHSKTLDVIKKELTNASRNQAEKPLNQQRLMLTVCRPVNVVEELLLALLEKFLNHVNWATNGKHQTLNFSLRCLSSACCSCCCRRSCASARARMRASMLSAWNSLDWNSDSSLRKSNANQH